MKVTLEYLQNIGLSDGFPDALKKLKEREYFVFYYTVIEEESKLLINDYEIVGEVNRTLYRTLQDRNRQAQKSLKIGFFSNTFETRDGLFYQFLRTYNEYKVTEFYKSCVEQDKIIDLNIATNSNTEIFNSDDFRRAISFFCEGRIQPIMQVYDMVSDAIKNRLSVDLYGTLIKKVVSLIVYDGGVLTEINGGLRFMVIGENAKLSKEQSEKLIEAKALIRSMIPFDEVYALTGWALSQNDGKWRTNISDNQAKIIETNLVAYKGRHIYVPSGETIASVEPFLANPERIIGSPYKGRLFEVLEHPTLYNYYPNLAILPIVYFYGQSGSGRNDSFYFSPDERGGYILINGCKASGDSLSILLHEIQHAIQHKENFSTGGNLFLARFVASVGSNSVRKIFSSIHRMQKYFKQYLLNNEARLELIDCLYREYPKTESSSQLKKNILELLKDRENYQYKAEVINFYLVLYVSEQGDFATNEVVMYLESKIDERLINELFQNIESGYSEAKIYREILLRDGNSEKDIDNILFKGYENLYGEMESRSVQSSRFVESEFRNYFYLTKWENSPLQQLTVIDGIEEVLDCEKIKAALETKDGEYVLHFKKNRSSEPFLHELGHIVHDCLDKLGHSEEMQKEFQKDYSFDDLNEWFVACFLSYLKSHICTQYLKEDLKYHLISENDKVSRMLDSFFKKDEYSSRLNYLQTILSLD